MSRKTFIASVSLRIHNSFVTGMAGRWPTFRNDKDGQALAISLTLRTAATLAEEKLIGPDLKVELYDVDDAMGIRLTVVAADRRITKPVEFTLELSTVYPKTLEHDPQNQTV